METLLKEEKQYLFRADKISSEGEEGRRSKRWPYSTKVLNSEK